jgi:hypothetical protein
MSPPRSAEIKIIARAEEAVSAAAVAATSSKAA